MYVCISADPCRQQGERVREEITSNKCCAVQVRGKRGGDRKGSQVQSKKPKKGSEKGGAVSANVASERSTKQEVRSKNAEARVNERQKVMFGTLGYGPRAQSVLHCHGVLALRGGPLTGAVPHESQLSDNAGKLAVGSAGTQGKARFELQDDAGKVAGKSKV